ncbi:TetR/AcrR family transcriptional regulator [Streptomyces capitiformicae]|uniref:TetR family transcriptional regulator n=1 Tax=Streptomyces capitiformicae TaxID=2014920 RepID=A0A918Z9Y8_9ACTN|nr:TetR/AcrR family transcriptional regulator [Streptomyces capitiformicae]GHE41659.1 TetR family transcriptional regulator [Streptomyces capitiformicae]
MTQNARAMGRPRDPQVDHRVAEAAVALFGEEGWSSFSIESVARRAGVGKASVYLRWSSKEQLLADALTQSLGRIEDVDTGTVRGDLVRLVRQLLELFTGEHADAALRLGLEARRTPGLAERYEAMAEAQILAARAMVHRGMDRGELPRDTSVTLLLDALCGGAMNHALATPARLRAELPKHAGEYAEALVDFILASVLTKA